MHSRMRQRQIDRSLTTVDDLIIQHEIYREMGAAPTGRNVEADSAASEVAGEKVFE